MLVRGAITAAALSLGLSWVQGLGIPGFVLYTRVFVVAAIVLVGLAQHLRASKPREAETLVLLATISLGTALALTVRLFPAPGLVMAATSLALTVWLRQVLRAQRLSRASLAGP